MEAAMINAVRLSDPLRALLVIAAAFIVATMAPPVASAASAAVGDTFIFRVINGYNNESQGRIQYRIDNIDADRITVSVSTDVRALGLARTAIYTKDGNWLRHTLINHDEPVEYDFSPPYPAYVFPLETGKSWSQRVTATNPVTGKRYSVRVDGDVLGSEHTSTPAGAFDTVKIRRRVYAGDWDDGFKRETNIVETDWYAPALGRVVKSESNSGYVDPTRCQADSMTYHDKDRERVPRANPIIKTGWSAPAPGRSESEPTRREPGRIYDQLACDPMRGDWNLFELVEIRSQKP
jgi:hypothetical protein